MKRLEFQIVADVMGIKNKIGTTEGKYSTIEDVFSWKGVNINFSGNYYTIIDGPIPLELAKIIYEKYPKNEFEIRVAGGGSELDPEDWATCEEYDDYAQDILKDKSLEFEEQLAKLRIKHDELLKNNYDNMFLNTYHIDTKEGLIIFLAELNDYYERKYEESNNINSLVEKQSEKIQEANEKFLDIIELSRNTEGWMKKNNATSLLNVKNNYNLNRIDMTIRVLLDKFDKTINPFMNPDLKMDLPKDFSERFYLHGFRGKTKEHTDETHFHFIERKFYDYIDIYVDEDGLSYQLMFHEEGIPEKYVSVFHTYDKNNNGDEMVCVEYAGGLDLRYHIINQTSGKTYFDIYPVTEEQKLIIIRELRKAIPIARNIIENNLFKTKEAARLIRKNKQA